MPNVFISYARQDSSVAHRLSEMLTAEGQTVFFDQAIAAGEDYSEIIENALTHAEAVVVLLSRNSNRSRWVDAELRSALQTGKVVIPVLLDEEATSNWVWPLVSDRKAIKLESPDQIAGVVDQILRAIGYTPDQAAYPVKSSRWVTLVIAFLSAIVGALFMWLTR